MLEFAARAAGAGSVARGTGGGDGINAALSLAAAPSFGPAQYRSAGRGWGFFAGRPLDPELDPGQHADHLLAQARQHLLEDLEGFALIFIERVALRISSEIDPLAQMIEA